ncbi:MAG: L,D-transpeptidase family protein [Rhodomicrobium sp.]
MPKQSLAQKRQKKTRKRRLARLLALSDACTKGRLHFGGLDFPAAIGKGGVRALKREGDGATPRGFWRAMRVYYRPDRLRRPASALPAEPLRPGFGWCDAPGDRNYNRRVPLPYRASAERLWRGDGLYDAILVLDYNFTRRSAGRGSAIFVHIARTGFAPTEGCIALKRQHLLRLLAVLPRNAVFAAGRNLALPRTAR